MTLHDEGREWETLNISEETLAHIVLKARSFDVLSNETDAEDASDSADDRFVSVLDSHADNAALQELVAAIDGLSAEEQASLVTIFWIGRGDFDASQWNQAQQTAMDRADTPTGQYLARHPLLSDMLEEGAAALGVSLAGIESAAMYHQANPDPMDSTS
tara:strand:- start:13 stop:489 length:477 start_codon:yes stop_codon:yes gene_type:complete